MLRLRFTWLVIRGRIDEAMLLVCKNRDVRLSVSPREAHLVRAGLAAGRLLDDAPAYVPPLPRPTLRLVVG